MFVSSYRYDGDPTQLVEAYERMVAMFQTSAFLVHLCAVDADGITVLDACPDEATSRSFSASPEFRAATEQAGLPRPVITPLGEVHRLHTQAQAVVPR